MDQHLKNNWDILGISLRDQEKIYNKLEYLRVIFALGPDEEHAGPIIEAIKKIEKKYGLDDYKKKLPIEPPNISLSELEKNIDYFLSSHEPHVIGLIGPPASGKTSLIDILRTKYKGRLKFFDEYWNEDLEHHKDVTVVKELLRQKNNIVIAAGFITDQKTDLLIYVDQSPGSRYLNVSRRLKNVADEKRAKFPEFFRPFDFHVYELERMKANFRIRLDSEGIY